VVRECTTRDAESPNLARAPSIAVPPGPGTHRRRTLAQLGEGALLQQYILGHAEVDSTHCGHFLLTLVLGLGHLQQIPPPRREDATDPG
jgi:hypothetical protein